MPYKPELSIEGIQKAQARNLRRIAAIKPKGAAEQAVRDALIALHRYAVQITHVGKYKVRGAFVGGGSLRASHRIKHEGLSGMIYIDPKSRNPRSKTPPHEYGVYENARGGTHAFYDRTVDEIGGTVIQRAQDKIREAILYAK